MGTNDDIGLANTDLQPTVERPLVHWSGTVGERSIVIEPMTEADIPGVTEVDAECFPTHWSLHSYHRELENPASIYLVAREQERIVGFGGMWVSADEAHITTFGVRRSHRRQGIGARLLAALLCAARAAGATRATLEVRESNVAAISLYRWFGFEDVGARPRYYETEDARIMWLYSLDGEQLTARVRELLRAQEGAAEPAPTVATREADCRSAHPGA